MPSRPIKRSSSDSSDTQESTPPSSPDKKPRIESKEKNKPTKLATPTVVKLAPDGRSAKSVFAEMIIEAGIKALSKAEVQQATGLSPEAQKDMLRKDKGSLRKALYGACASL